MAVGDPLYPLDRPEKRAPDQDDRGAGGEFDEVGGHQAGETDQDAAEDRQQHDPPKVPGKLGGDGDRDGEERDDEEDSDDLDQRYDGKGRQDHQPHFQRRDGEPSRPGILLVERNGDKAVVIDRHRAGDNQGQKKGDEHVRARDGQDVPEQEAHQVGGVAGGHVDEEDADCHADGPEDADEQIVPAEPFFLLAADQNGGRQHEGHRPEERADSQPVSDPEAAECGVAETAADEDHPPGYDEGSDDAADDARHDSDEDCILHEFIGKNGAHGRFSYNASFSRMAPVFSSSKGPSPTILRKPLRSGLRPSWTGKKASIDQIPRSSRGLGTPCPPCCRMWV